MKAALLPLKAIKLKLPSDFNPFLAGAEQLIVLTKTYIKICKRKNRWLFVNRRFFAAVVVNSRAI